MMMICYKHPPFTLLRTLAAGVVPRLSSLLLGLALLAAFPSCVDEEEFDDTPQGNLDALWKIIDEHYCFFDYKNKEYGLDWNAVYNKYKVRVNSDMSSAQLFEVLTGMLGELRDGHVNLSSSHDFGRYWSWYESYPSNLSDSLLRRYMGTDYKIAAGLKYCILDDNIGYVRYESFQSSFGDGNLAEVLGYMLFCRGLIIDVRSNTGGDLTNAELLAARFCHEPTLVGYSRHKTGPGHDDFSEMKPRYLQPSSGLRWHKPVCVLTNRMVFSAANEFVMYMKALPRVTIVGDHTGGGAGMPFSSSLPNGWGVRFSAVPMYDADGQSCEFGIDPDVQVHLSEEDYLRGEDTIVETARKLLSE
jgi:hypothetical protein